MLPFVHDPGGDWAHLSEGGDMQDPESSSISKYLPAFLRNIMCKCLLLSSSLTTPHYTLFAFFLARGGGGTVVQKPVSLTLSSLWIIQG